jgi:thiol-disulfide isomerase/thioredoxin
VKKSIAGYAASAALAVGAVFAPAGWCAVVVVQQAGFDVKDQEAAAKAPAQAAPPKPANKETAVHLRNGDYVAGRLADSDRPGAIVWTSPAFASNLELPASIVESVRFAEPDPDHGPAEKADSAETQYMFELVGGDLVVGALESLDEERVVANAPPLGKVAMNRAALARLYRNQSAGRLVFFGPAGLDGWTVTTPKWREEGGALASEKPGASIERTFADAPSACYEMEISWRERGDFEIVLGEEPDPPAQPAQRAVLRAAVVRQPSASAKIPVARLDVWDGVLVLVREDEKQADVAVLREIPEGPGRLQVQVYLDQKGRVLVYSPTGELLADLDVPASEPRSIGRLHLKNKSGDLRLERLRVSKWNGEPPQPVQAERARVHRIDGAVVYGALKTYDPATRSFLVEADGKTKRIPDHQLQDAVLAPPAPAAAPRAVLAATRSGMRFSGELVRVQAPHLVLKCPGIQGEVSLPIDSLAALLSLAAPAEAPDSSAREGRLEADGVRLLGSLADADAAGAGAPGALVWRPHGAQVASPLAPHLAARIVYTKTPPAAQAKSAAPGAAMAVPPPVAPADALGLLLNNLAGRRAAPAKPAPAAAPPSPLGPHVLHLVSGDMLPCLAERIDEHGLHMRTPVSNATFVPHDRILALELLPTTAPVAIPKAKKDRLLTLPRSQKFSPPTHLIRSLQGDYLRCRLDEMDESDLRVEVRLESRAIPRKNVARILWLHGEPADPSAPPEDQRPPAPAPGARPSDGLVLAMLSDGNRLAFSPRRVEGSQLFGESDSLGACRVDLEQTDQLLLGGAVDEAAAQLVFRQWKLTHAPEPIEADEESSDAGRESPLVGKPAPDFTLDLVAGGKFKLSEHKEKVLVLDFWASWCGPCMQTMPKIERVVGEFPGVELVAVNLAETPDQVKAALARLNLDVAAALDETGRVAQMYGATAIPQTVVVGRGGVVARVFVGGGGPFEQNLRDALQAALAPPPQTAE